MKSINGFEIEKFNQYNLEEGKKLSTCPLCSNDRHSEAHRKQKCLMVDWESGIGTCQHCGEVIQLHTYKKKNVRKEPKKIYTKPVWNNNTDLSDIIVKWFEDRCIPQHVLCNMKIRSGLEWMPQTQKEEYVIEFNYFRKNELVNVKYRDGNKNFKMVKDAEKIVYGYDMALHSDYVVIVEGEIDQLSFVTAGVLSCVSTPNGSTKGGVNLDYLDNCIDLFKSKGKIYLCLDKDAPGQHAQKELIRRLGAHRCWIIDLEDCKDANEYLQKYGSQKLRNRFEDAEKVPLEEVVNIEENSPDLNDFYVNGMDKGYKTGIDKFDEVFSIISGTLSIITGIPTHGKSEFMDFLICRYILENKWKIAFCSEENGISRNGKVSYVYHQDKLIQKILGHRPTSEEVIDGGLAYKETLKFLSDKIFWMDFKETSLEKVVLKTKELVSRKGINALILDPFNKIPMKDGASRDETVSYSSQYLLKLENLAKECGIVIFLIAHPTKMRKEHGSKEMPVPNLYDVKGASEFYEMPFFGLSVYRHFKPYGDYVTVKILKCKFRNLGINNAEVHFGFNINNGRYSTISDITKFKEGDEFITWDNSNWLNSSKQKELPLPEEKKEAPVIPENTSPVENINGISENNPNNPDIKGIPNKVGRGFAPEDDLPF